MSIPDYNLSGKVAVVTGSSRGIGFAIAEEFLKNHTIVIISSRTEDRLGKAIQDLRAKVTGGKITGHVLDVSNSKSVESFFRFVEDEFGAISVLVNNAGIYYVTPAENISEDEWREVVDTNLFGTFLCSKSALPLLRKNSGGSIINISSQAGRSGRLYGAHYNSSKAGVIGLTQGLALEWGKHNIRVNAIAPGFIVTEQSIRTCKELNTPLDYHKNKTALNRLGDVFDVADLALFLASNKAKYITGQTFLVNGGLLII